MIKPLKGYKGFYNISSEGKVFSLKNKKELKLRYHNSGYIRLALYKEGKRNDIFLHRLVAINFLENPNFKLQVNHKDGNKMNNKVDNLEWVSPSENSLHSYKVGLQFPIRGEKHYSAKLTCEEVKSIRNLYIPRKYSQRRLAKEFNVHQSSIKDILSGKNWGYL